MLKLLVLATLLTVALRLWFLHFEGRTLYYPMRPWEATPADAGLKFQEITLQSADGVRLSAWYIPNPRGTFTLLYLHGNAGNISHRVFAVPFFYKMGLSTFLLDYRGYGKSEGRPSEKAFYADARTAYDHVRNVLRTDPQRIILFGESLGGAVALELANQVPVRCVICDGTFSSALDMGRIYFPFLPVRWLITQKYDSATMAANLHVPKWFVHSRQDQIVPFKLGERLFAAACAPKEFVERSGDHSNYLADPVVYERLLKVITSPAK